MIKPFYSTLSWNLHSYYLAVSNDIHQTSKISYAIKHNQINHL